MANKYLEKIAGTYKHVRQMGKLVTDRHGVHYPDSVYKATSSVVPHANPAKEVKRVDRGLIGKALGATAATGAVAAGAHNMATNPDARDVAKGWVSPSWARNSVAERHGEKGHHSMFDAQQHSDMKNISNKSMVHTIAGTVLGGASGAAAGALGRGKLPIKGRMGAMGVLGAAAGYVGGTIHGTHAGVKDVVNDEKARHEKKASKDDFKEDKWRTAGKGMAYGLGGMIAGGVVGRSFTRGLPHVGKAGRDAAQMAGEFVGGVAAASAGHGSSIKNQKKEHYDSEILKHRAMQIKMKTEHMKKQAALTAEHKKDIANTATIGAAGAATNVLADKILHPNGPKGSGLKSALLGGSLGLAADYGAVKLNNVVNKYIDKTHGKK